MPGRTTATLNGNRNLGPNSGIASEFYVTYQLYRRGYVGMVTYGNTKALDIVAAHPDDNRTATIQVKSLKGKTNWPLTLKGDPPKGNHFYVLVGYGDRWSECDVAPDVWVIPAKEIKRLLLPWSKSVTEQTCVGYRDLLKRGERFRGAWHLIFP